MISRELARLNAAGLAIGLVLALCWPAHAQPVPSSARAESTEEIDYPFFSTTPRYGEDRKRNYYLAPIGSFFLPGLGQIIEQQWEPALTYAGVAGFGIALATAAANEIKESDVNRMNYDEYDSLQRQYRYGSQLYLFAGEMSAFHSFRTSIESRRKQGEFSFLTTNEDPGDLLLAPFAFSEIKKPTTFVPLLVGAALAYTIGSDQRPHADFDGGDAAFTGGVSYNAGVGEEALFRGYLMPVFREKTGSDFWSNAGQAVIFGAAHISPNNPYPVFQTLFGYYFGWLVQRNGWSMQQAIFVHTWWDVLIIGAETARNQSDPFYRLPTLQFYF
jgi:membrane protease YdiL (CAAX protease family)